MPPLSQIARSESPKGYAAVENLPAPSSPPKESGKALGANPYIRCPLPPFNATSDTLRQFDENGKVPARRVIPLPPQTSGGGQTTVIQNTSVTSQAGGGGSSVVPVMAKTVTINVPTLFPGTQATFTVAILAKIAVLMIMGSSDLCEVRIYGDPATQGSDAPRATDSAVPFEIAPGVVSDVVFDTPPLLFNWQNRLFVNQDAPQTSNMYVTVVNPTMGAVTPSVTITYLPLET